VGSLGGLREAKCGRVGSMVVKGGGASVSKGEDEVRSGLVVEQQGGQAPVRFPLGSVSSLLGSKAAKGAEGGAGCVIKVHCILNFGTMQHLRRAQCSLLTRDSDSSEHWLSMRDGESSGNVLAPWSWRFPPTNKTVVISLWHDNQG